MTGPSRVPPRRPQGGAGWGIIVPAFLAFLFACWPFIVWHGCKYGGSGLSGCGSGSDWVWNGQTWTACGIWWGILASPFVIAGVNSAARKRAVRPPKGRLRVETAPPTMPPEPPLPRPRKAVPAPPSAPFPPVSLTCPHLGAVRVENLADPDQAWHCWCPDCDPDGKALLPANWKRPCCGTPPGALPGEGHAYNCPQGARG